jgi:long-chain acyl-CoA synthetase
MIKRIHLTLELFSVDNDTLTPTMKYKRQNAAKLYQAEIARMYSLGETTPSNL